MSWLKGVKPLMIWSAAMLSLVVVPLFALLIWQLIALDPVGYCRLVSGNGVPPGDNCFKLLTQGLHIKGWVIWGLLATLAAFVLTILVALVNAKLSVTGPGGTQVSIGKTADPAPTIVVPPPPENGGA